MPFHITRFSKSRYKKPRRRKRTKTIAKLIAEMVTENRVLSQELGLELANTGDTLRLFDPRTKEFLRTPAEEAARAERLAAKLRALGLDPDQI